MSKEHQNQWVMSRLKAGCKLSSKDAALLYGIQDLPKRISELRQRGEKIEQETVYGTNRYGLNTHWCVYWVES